MEKLMLKIFACYDKKSQAYTTPNFFTHAGQCLRALEDLVNEKNPNSMISSHPEDFSIWHLGEFDEISGEITPVKPTHVQEAAGLVRGK
jgi:hypothetical protein